MRSDRRTLEANEATRRHDNGAGRPGHRNRNSEHVQQLHVPPRAGTMDCAAWGHPGVVLWLRDLTYEVPVTPSRDRAILHRRFRRGTLGFVRNGPRKCWQSWRCEQQLWRRWIVPVSRASTVQLLDANPRPRWAGASSLAIITRGTRQVAMVWRRVQLLEKGAIC